ncbi:MAG: amidohydrolase family protein [Proteobacteria bacterium]|nr:amidohydrolase family protein [Pseudomonadota bacterium]MCP4921541.1 amidohydrolase family protein [Pseudomonadota bacterium]
MHDILIKNGTLIDGTGTERRQADVAIQGDRIVAVGRDLGPAREEIDASGCIVTPGFVDVHTHYDAQVTWDPMMTPSSWHGVTTVVMGSCGVGFAPARPDRHEWLIGLMEGVEDIPGAAMHEGIQWEWETFPEYMDAIERRPHVIDFGAQIPHGALRAYVMGERGADNEEATPDDVAEMSRIVEEALGAGALGFSTSRTLLHKSVFGVPVPGTFAHRDELFGIGDALKRADAGVFQCASEHADVPRETRWMRELAEETGRPVTFNLSQTDQAPTLWKELVEVLDQAHADGVPLYAQVAGRAIGIVMNWRLTAHPFRLFPAFHAEQYNHPEFEDLVARLRLPEVRERIVNDTPIQLDEFATFVTRSFHKMFKIGANPDYEPSEAVSVAAEAARRGVKPEEVAYEWMLENDGEGTLYFPLFNYSDGNLELLKQLHAHPQTLMGLSDAAAHCGAICDGGMPTFMLTHWARDRTRGERLPLEYIVMRQTSQTASLFGLRDRGVVAPGMKADVNVIDFDELRLLAPEILFDLPAGGRRLAQRPEGYKATVCSGEVIFRDGTHTGALPGKLVRGAQEPQAQA